MSRFILRLLWNGAALAGIAFMLWSGFNAWASRPEPPTPTATVTVAPTVIEAVRRVNKQIFIEQYNAVDITRTDAPDGWLAWLGAIGVQQEFTVQIRGTVPAGFDLSQLSEGDVWVSADGKRVQLTLPPPKIFRENVALDLENSHVLAETDHCPHLLCPGDLRTYQESILPEGRNRLVRAAEQSEILAETAREGKAFYEQLLRSMGIDEPRVVVLGYS